MKNSQYRNGLKIAAAVLQLVFLVVMIVVCSFMVNLYTRSMSSLWDFGNDSFFHSYYYIDNYTDKIAEAEKIYEICLPWLKGGMIVLAVAFVGFCFTMLYLTLATGRNSENDNISLYRIDYIPTELLFMVWILFVTGLVMFCMKLNRQDWNLSSAMIIAGTLTFLTDVVLLTLYLSFVRKIKANIIIKYSLTSFLVHLIKDAANTQKVVNRTIIRYSICAILGLFFAGETFSRGNIWAMAGLFLIFVYLAVHFLRQALWRKQILEGIIQISSGKLDYKFDTSKFKGDYYEIAEKINGIGEGLNCATEENLKNERLKTELITNVSHDIKTPLTSIINYVQLIKMEKVQNQKVENYVNILEKKSLRLKQLTEDLVEVSKITSGAILLDMQPINMIELIYQTGGEFNEIFEDMGLTIITRLPQEPVMIHADGSRLWRVIQNLYNNVAKYALKDTRVYVELKAENGVAEFSIKDISAEEIRKTSQDLSERFVRGEDARGTEGSGLGLSIAKNLTTLMGGEFEIEVEDDLFTARIKFRTVN